jgi:hypothetical protein
MWHWLESLGFLLIGAGIGLLNAIRLLFFPEGDYFFAVPLFWQDFLSYPLYFLGGALAQRNKWMDDIKEKSRAAIYGSMRLSFVIVWAVVIFAEEKDPAVVLTLLKGIVWKGLLSMTICLAMTVFFMDHANKS